MSSRYVVHPDTDSDEYGSDSDEFESSDESDIDAEEIAADILVEGIKMPNMEQNLRQAKRGVPVHGCGEMQLFKLLFASLSLLVPHIAQA